MSTTQIIAEQISSREVKSNMVRIGNFFDKIKTAFHSKEKVSTDILESQKLAVAIINKAIAHSNAILLTAPISETRYIHFNDIFIRIEYDNVTIINGVYSYHIVINYKDAEYLINKFNLKLEQTRKQWEREIVTKTHRSLNNILEELNN